MTVNSCTSSLVRTLDAILDKRTEILPTSRSTTDTKRGKLLDFYRNNISWRGEHVSEDGTCTQIIEMRGCQGTDYLEIWSLSICIDVSHVALTFVVHSTAIIWTKKKMQKKNVI